MKHQRVCLVIYGVALATTFVVGFASSGGDRFGPAVIVDALLAIVMVLLGAAIAVLPSGQPRRGKLVVGGSALCVGALTYGTLLQIPSDESDFGAGFAFLAALACIAAGASVAIIGIAEGRTLDG